MVRVLRKIQRSSEEPESGNEDVGAENGPEPPAGTTTARSSDASASTEDAAAADSGDRAVSLDQIFDMLRNSRRRQVFRILTETDRIEIGELAERIAARELDKPRKRLSSQERKRLYVALYQAHLPKLADVGAITYDERRGLVTPGPVLHRFISHLPGESASATTGTRKRRWANYISNILG